MVTQENLIAYCLSLPGAYLDYPFDTVSPVLRHRGNQKMFALLMMLGGSPCVNLKCDPLWSDVLRRAYAGVTPGYHQNKEHWNTVKLGSDLPDEEIYAMVNHSHALTKPRQSK